MKNAVIIGSKTLTGQYRHHRRRQGGEEKIQRTDRFALKVVFQDRKSCRVGRIGDDRQTAASHRPGDQRVLEAIADAFHQ